MLVQEAFDADNLVLRVLERAGGLANALQTASRAGVAVQLQHVVDTVVRVEDQQSRVGLTELSAEVSLQNKTSTRRFRTSVEYRDPIIDL